MRGEVNIVVTDEHDIDEKSVAVHAHAEDGYHIFYCVVSAVCALAEATNLSLDDVLADIRDEGAEIMRKGADLNNKMRH
jgi:hypothetical protein